MLHTYLHAAHFNTLPFLTIRTACGRAVGEDADFLCTPIRGSRFKSPISDQTKQAFHSSEVGELVAVLSGKDGTLTFPSTTSHCVPQLGQMRIQIVH